MSEQSPEQNIDNLNQTAAGTSDTATEKAFLDFITVRYCLSLDMTVC